MNCSIWITEEDDNTFDINVWDEDENERYDELEMSEIENYEMACALADQTIICRPWIIFERKLDILRQEKLNAIDSDNIHDCRICGKKARLYDWNFIDMWRVMCEGVHNSGKERTTQEEAIDDWNNQEGEATE